MGEAAAGGLLLVLLGGVLAHATARGSARPAVASTLPACVHVGHRVAVPSGWRVPLPPGTVVTQVESGAVRQLVGFAPASFPDLVRWYREDFPKLGYTLGNGDAENDEAEADYSGHGVRGRFRINAIVGCSGATVIAIAAG